MGWEAGALSFSFEKEFAVAYGPADFQVRELFPSTSSVEKRENPTCHFGLSSVISVLRRARFSRSVLAVQLEFQTTFLAGWSTGHSALHFPLVVAAPGKAEPAASGTQGRAAVDDPRYCIWVFSRVCFFIFVETLWDLNTKAALTECEKLEEQGCKSQCR